MDPEEVVYKYTLMHNRYGVNGVENKDVAEALSDQLMLSFIPEQPLREYPGGYRGIFSKFDTYIYMIDLEVHSAMTKLEIRYRPAEGNEWRNVYQDIEELGDKVNDAFKILADQ